MNNFCKTLKKGCFILPFIFVLNALRTDALQIVYPKTANTDISAASTFIIGSTTPDAKLKIPYLFYAENRKRHRLRFSA